MSFAGSGSGNTGLTAFQYQAGCAISYATRRASRIGSHTHTGGFEVTTTSTGTGSTRSVLEMLNRQHRLIKERFTTVLDARTSDARARAFFDLRRLLAVHEAAEEEIVHPIARRNPAGGAGEIVKQPLSEEFTAKEALAHLEAMDINSPAFISCLRLLQHNVNEHAALEETEEFAQLQGEPTDEQLARLGRACEMAQGIAPTRPHPATESTAANAFVGPFAAMLDHARDAISAPNGDPTGD